MPVMSEVRRARQEAWAGLVDELATPPPTMAEVLRERPALARRTREAGASARTARQALAKVLVAVEARPRDTAQLQLVRAWSGCVDEILALTERLCGVVAAV
jgi:hypothetical protein